MSWYRIIFIIVSLSISFVSTVEAKKLRQISEDELVISAIFYESYKAYDSAYLLYKKLFENKKDEIYLFKASTSALLSQKHIQESILMLQDWEKMHPKQVTIKRLLLPLYLTARQNKDAQKEAQKLLELSLKSHDLELASQAFLYSGLYKKGVELLTKAYNKMPNETILLRLTSLMDEMTGERKKAIQLLETHRRMNTSSNDILKKLLLLYQKEKNIDGLISIYQTLYDEEKDSDYLQKIVDIYLSKRDYDAAIEYMERYKLQNTFPYDTILYELYRTKKYYTKAIALLEVLFEKDKDPKWIAEKAILAFEKAKNKDDKKMLHDVIRYFEEAIKLGNDDSLYLNYYGYTLIDKDIDIKKGMKVISDALKQQPYNTYYLDSLAWGYYKQKSCEKAYSLMKKVVEEEGLTQKDIVAHWDAIQKCK